MKVSNEPNLNKTKTRKINDKQKYFSPAKFLEKLLVFGPNDVLFFKILSCNLAIVVSLKSRHKLFKTNLLAYYFCELLFLSLFDVLYFL